MFKLNLISTTLSDNITALDLYAWIDHTKKCIKNKSYAKNQKPFLCLSPFSAHSNNT